jgi:hypothetical protein
VSVITDPLDSFIGQLPTTVPAADAKVVASIVNPMDVAQTASTRAVRGGRWAGLTSGDSAPEHACEPHLYGGSGTDCHVLRSNGELRVRTVTGRDRAWPDSKNPVGGFAPASILTDFPLDRSSIAAGGGAHDHPAGRDERLEHTASCTPRAGVAHRGAPEVASMAHVRVEPLRPVRGSWQFSRYDEGL